MHNIFANTVTANTIHSPSREIEKSEIRSLRLARGRRPDIQGACLGRVVRPQFPTFRFHDLSIFRMTNAHSPNRKIEKSAIRQLRLARSRQSTIQGACLGCRQNPIHDFPISRLVDFPNDKRSFDKSQNREVGNSPIASGARQAINHSGCVPGVSSEPNLRLFDFTTWRFDE